MKKLTQIQYLASRICCLGLMILLCFGQLNAQNTPLGTPATQNADGSTATAGTPAACAAGFGIYSIDHEDATIGFLPGGFCVTTELENNGTTNITVTGTPNGAGIGDVDNIVLGGGRINYSSTDGGDLDATYNFCEPVTNPYVFIGDLETFTTINFFDCAGNPVNINLMNGQSRFAVSGNSALITGTTSSNQDGYVQVPGTYSCLLININNPAPFTLDVIQIAVGVCMPTPPTGTMTCPYDLYMWKKDEFCTPVYRDANGVFYEKDQNNNNIASLGNELWVNNPICGELVLLEADCAIQDNNCTPDFTCDAVPVEVQFHEPMGSGCLYSTYWYDITSFGLNDPDPGNQWSAIFSGTDAFGLPAHPSTPTNAAENCGLDWLGDNEGDIDFDDEAGGANEDEQLQLDGWLYVANHLECIQFRIGSSATDHSVALYLGSDLNNMTLVTEETDDQAGAGNNTSGVVGSYCIPDMVSTTSDACGWKILRVRIYAHDDDTAYDPAIDWSFNGGLTWDVVEEQWFVSATSASDNTPPTGVAVGGGGCTPIPTTVVDTDNVLVDLEGKLWQIPGNCNQAPTNLYEPNIPNGNNAEEGDHLSLIPYCIIYNDNAMIDCEPCAIDITVEGCACSNPDNTFSGDCIQSVTAYEQTLIVNSDINTSYTITASSGISGLAGPFMTAGTSETYTFFAAPGTPYSITITGDQSNTSQTYEGLCSAPDACNCPAQPEICGDGLDNDCDGLVDDADPDIAGNCALDCSPTPTPIEIQGRAMLLDGHMTHQVWSRECGNTGCCSSSINPHSCALTAFTCTDVNGLPRHNNACGPADPCAPVGMPQGSAGCTGNDVFTSLGSTHRQAPQFYSTAAEQTQLDGWLVLPPGITCFELKVNHPRAWDAQAIYMGAGIASMNFVGASSFPPAENYTNAVDCQNDANNNPNVTGENFQYNTTSGATPITVAGCTWNVVRVRAYIFDESWYHVTPVQWNIGNGFETIPSRYLQSVGTAGWDTDNNKPTAADVVDLAPYCAFTDGDGDLFTLAGDFFALDPMKCEQIMESACLNCPSFHNYSCDEADTCVDLIEVDPATGNPITESPECDLELFTITPMIVDDAGSPGTGLLTRYWDHDQASCVSNQIQNESIFCAFSGYDPNAANCPNCLPEHPNFNTPTEADVIVGTLGTNTTPFANDVDNDNFVLRRFNRTSGENIQQDGWLLVPPNVDCIAFRLNSPAWDAGAMYLGTDINNMTFVGENINRNGNNPIDTFYYELPANPQTVSCTDCDNQTFTLLRVRTYHHDNNMMANTIWEWNVSGEFKNVPTGHLFPVTDHCSDNIPANLCPTYTAGTPFFAVLEDANSNEQFDAGEKWYRAPNTWTNCDAAKSGFDSNMIPAMERVAIEACDVVSRVDCSICCELVVTCPMTDQGEFNCLTDVPAAVTTEAGFEALLGTPDIDDNFCGTLVITSSDSNNGGTGCVASPLVITRIYTIADDETSEMCTVTYTVIDDVDPVITCAAGLTIECDESTDPANTGMSTAIDNCDTNVDVTFADVSTQGTSGCAQYSYTITRTWTATDDCGNTDECVQTINVDDTTPPTAVCRDITLYLGNNGEVTITPIDLNGGSTDNCSTLDELTYSASQTVFTCADLNATCDGSIPVTLTVTDACGNPSTCVANVFVRDDRAPTFTNCPGDFAVTLDPGDCNFIYDFEFFATDNCDTDVEIRQIEGPPSGTALMHTTVTRFVFEAEDNCGNIAVCAFDLTVNEWDGIETELGCNDNVQISLDENCMAIVGADLILEGGQYGCYDTRYGVILDKNNDGIYDAAEGNELDANDLGQWYNAQVTDLVTGNSCWGRIHVEDKLIPDLVCEDITVLCSADLTPGAAINSSTSTTITPGTNWASTVQTDEIVSTSGAPSNATVTDVNLSVDITHTWVGDLNIDLISPSGTVVSVLSAQCGNTDDIDATFDDQAAGPIVCSGTPVISGDVQPENPFSVFNGEPVNGDWIVRVTDGVAGDGGTINGITLNIGYAGTNPFPIPAPGVVTGPNPDGSYTVTGFDACGPATLTFVDSEDPRQCQAINNVITRTWTVVDGSGNTKSCDQIISLTRATLADVIAPSNYDGIDQPALNCEDRCDPNDTRFCGPVNLYWNVLPAGHEFAGHPNPEPELWGCGVVKCFGTGAPSGASCGDIQQTFTDTRINVCATGPSDGCYKILREWTVLDWCTGDTRFFNQIIKVEDTEGPEINDIDDVTISTDVWGCEADWYATEAWLQDNCSSDPIGYTVESTGGTVEFINGRWKISGLAPGTYTVTYVATDCCGNETRQDITLTVIDDVPPVVVCDAHTVVALTTTNNINTDNLGLTKIFAHTFDDGSFDNCSDQVYFKAIRMDEFNSNGNTKNGEDVRLGDWASIDCDAANGDDDLRVFPPWYQGPQSYFDDHVKFCCDDINDGPIMVVLRVFDIDPTPYTFGRQFPFVIPVGANPDDYAGVMPEAMAVGGALYGHYSDCMVEVTVQDKLPPYVVAPPNITVTCDFWFEFDPDRPNDYTDALDGYFGKVVTGPGAADPINHDSIIVHDRVCEAHPRFAEYAPATIFDDPCYDDQYDIFWGYDGYALDNCGLDLEQTIVPNLHCGRGSILRRWRASDPSGNWSNTATQRITIIDCKEWYVPTACWRFTPKDVSECDLVNIPNVGLRYRTKLIEWPCDVDITTCQGQGNGLDAFHPDNLAVNFEQDRRPRMDDDNCNLMASTYTDEVFTFIDGACFKIFRTWKVIDWCLYEDFQNGVYTGAWSWEWTQVIKLLNQTGPTFADCTDKTFCGYGDPSNPQGDQCVGVIELRPDVSDDCTPLEDLRIDYKLDLDNDGNYDELGYSDNYGLVYPFPNPNFLPVRRFAAELANADGTYPVGTHRILWAAEDGCGNTNICQYLFTIEDCKPPTAYCEIGVSTIPMPQVAGGYVDIWASDFDLGSYDNCTAQENLVFSFSTDINDRSRRLTCADAGQNLSYTVYVWDEAGNYSSCLVGVVLTDCSGNFSITGDIRNEEGIEVEQVEVHLDGSMTDMEMTGVQGIFDFLNLTANQNYTVTPEKDINPLNGVTTYDLVLISKHILGVQNLPSPYKMIAADVNKSGSVTTFDMVELRKLILYIDTEFRSNTSWRFVEASYDFNGNPSNPFASPIPETYSINGLTQHEVANFIAVKTGDVNCSAAVNSLLDSEDRSFKGDLIFNIDDQQLKAGEEHTVDFLAKDFSNILGYQFSLNFNSSAVEFAGVEAAALSNLDASNFGLALLDRGVITTSWNSQKAIALDDEAVAFSITFRAKTDVLLSEILSVSSDYTTAEAYNADAELINVALEFNTGTIVSNEFELMQNQPNPFKNETVIGFNLPEASTATLTIYDVSGRVLKQFKGDYAKGYNEESLNRSDLSAAGVLYYTLETDTNSSTKKMIVTE